MNFSSVNFDSSWKLFGSCPASGAIFNEDVILIYCEEDKI